MSEEPRGLSIARKMAEAADELYPDLKSRTTERIVKWEWATFTRYSLDPLYFELNKFRPGGPLDGEPDPPTGASGHAFDSDGNLIAELDQTEFPGMCYETYYVHEPDGVARYYYDYFTPHYWRQVAWMSRDSQGRISRIDSVSASGNVLSESFEYDAGGRVVRVRRMGPNQPYGDLNDLREIEYDEQGNVSRTLWVLPDGTRRTDFERPRPGRTLSSSRKVLSVGLRKAIVAAFRNAAPQSPVYALALYYCEAEYQHRLPPNVAFATEDDLERFRSEPPQELQYFAWYPAEWERHLSLQLDDELMDLCNSANEDIWQNELYDEVDTLLGHIASDLSRSVLPFPRSVMFVAYVTDLDLGDPVTDVQRFGTAETLAILREKELL